MDDSSQSSLLGVVLSSQLFNIQIDSSKVLVHILHLLVIALATSPVIVVQDISSTAGELFEFLLHREALSEIFAEKPVLLVFDEERQEVEAEEEKSEPHEEVLD